MRSLIYYLQALRLLVLLPPALRVLRVLVSRMTGLKQAAEMHSLQKSLIQPCRAFLAFSFLELWCLAGGCLVHLACCP